MAEETPSKRRRGGQPGNQNAKGKAGGNRTTRRHRFACGNRLGGAPLGNKNARRKRAAEHVAFLQQFGRDPETARWIKDHAAALDELKADDERDRALFDGYLGLTPEALADSGREYEHGLYSLLEQNDEDDEEVAA